MLPPLNLVSWNKFISYVGVSIKRLGIKNLCFFWTTIPNDAFMYVPETGQENSSTLKGSKAWQLRRYCLRGQSRQQVIPAILTPFLSDRSRRVVFMYTGAKWIIWASGDGIASFCLNGHNCTYSVRYTDASPHVHNIQAWNKAGSTPVISNAAPFCAGNIQHPRFEKFIYLYVWVYEPMHMCATLIVCVQDQIQTGLCDKCLCLLYDLTGPRLSFLFFFVLGYTVICWLQALFCN